MPATVALPEGWTCDPAHCEYLGRDDEGTQYWRVRWEVVTYRNGATRWHCTTKAWPVFTQTRSITR